MQTRRGPVGHVRGSLLARGARASALQTPGLLVALACRMPPSQHCALGKSGEDLACDELSARGYAILDRRYRTRTGEIDIVARDGDALVFVEVKTRRSIRYGRPYEAITRAKRRQIVRMASDYLARRRPRARSCRFDVVSVTIGADGRAAVEVLPHAFRADDG